MDIPKYSQRTPGEPYRLMSYFVFLTVIGAGILLGFNWKKLGKAEWQGKTILISIFLPVLMIALAIGWIILLLPHPELPSQFMLSIPMLAMGANLGFIWALARLQSGAYEKFKANAYEVLENYEYDVDGALFFGGMITLGFALFGVLIVPMF